MDEHATEVLPTASSMQLDDAPARLPARAVKPAANALALLRPLISIELIPLKEPEVDREFARMGAFERAIESLRYNLMLVEHRLGRNGWVRAWATTTIRILVFILLPLTGAAFVLGLLVPAAAALAMILGQIEAATKSLLLATIYFALALIIIAAFASGIAVLRRANRGKFNYRRRTPRL